MNAQNMGTDMSLAEARDIFDWHLEWAAKLREFPPSPEQLKLAIQAVLPGVRTEISQMLKASLEALK